MSIQTFRAKQLHPIRPSGSGQVGSPRPPGCEACQRDRDEDGLMSCQTTTGEWFLTCQGCPYTEEEEIHSVVLRDFFSSPAETIDWLARLHQHTWFTPAKFTEFMVRLRHDAPLFLRGVLRLL